MVMEITREQAPDVILMAPVCGPWSNMQNIQQDQQKVGEKRRRCLPMVEFVASIARYQLTRRRYFIIEVGSSEDGAKGSGSMVDRPFLSMILSAADPEPASSSLSELSAKVKLVLPHRLIIGLFAWDVSLQLSSRMSGSPPTDAPMISVVKGSLEGTSVLRQLIESQLSLRHRHASVWWE